MIAISASQEKIDLSEAMEFAHINGVTFIFAENWIDFIRSVLFWSQGSKEQNLDLIFLGIYRRCQELEVSEQGLKLWESLVK